MRFRSSIFYAPFFASIWMHVNPMFAADNTWTKTEAVDALIGLANETQDFGNRLVMVIGKKDNAQIAKLISTDDFGIIAMTKPDSIILAAVHFRDYTVLDALVKNHANINTPMPGGTQTALHYAVWRSDAQMVKYLLDHGADPFCDSRYETAVDVAFMNTRDSAFKPIPVPPRLVCVTAILRHLKQAGTPDTFLRWEEMLSQIRALSADPLEVVKEKGYLAQIHTLARQLDN